MCRREKAQVIGRNGVNSKGKTSGKMRRGLSQTAFYTLSLRTFTLFPRSHGGSTTLGAGPNQLVRSGSGLIKPLTANVHMMTYKTELFIME